MAVYDDRNRATASSCAPHPRRLTDGNLLLPRVLRVSGRRTVLDDVKPNLRSGTSHRGDRDVADERQPFRHPQADPMPSR